MGNPFVDGTKISTIKSTENALPIIKEYAWDFEKDCFIFEKGNHKIVTENEALKVWIYKVLKTERYLYYRVYDSNYGIELEKFIGKEKNNSDLVDKLFKYVEEALLVNPYIKKVDAINYDLDNEKLKLSIKITSIYGNFDMEVSM